VVNTATSTAPSPIARTFTPNVEAALDRLSKPSEQLLPVVLELGVGVRAECARLAEARGVRVELGDDGGPQLEVLPYRPVDHPVHDVLDLSRCRRHDLVAKAVLHRVAIAQEVEVGDADVALEPGAPAPLHLREHRAQLEQVALRVGSHLGGIGVELLAHRSQDARILVHHLQPRVE
jgi:hypothetical protein